MHDPAVTAPRAVERQSIFVPVPGGDRLHLLRLAGDPAGPPVLMVHGAIENGRIFWSNSGKGLAFFLAGRGFDVYVADLRGRGQSVPPIGPSSRHGQTEAITEDIPALVEAIVALRGRIPQHWVAHSWGGVLMSSTLARFPACRGLVASAVYFGSKRTIRAKNIDIFVKVRLVWGLASPLVAALVGYLPARALRMGSDSETAKSLSQCIVWVRKDGWVDPEDGFDYGAAIGPATMPPTLYFAGKNDRALGNPHDVRAFMAASGGPGSQFTLLAREGGNLHDYDHIDMLTHPDAQADHFPLVEAWFRGRPGRGPGPSQGFSPG